jgi:hypothetical protein
MRSLQSLVLILILLTILASSMMGQTPKWMTPWEKSVVALGTRGVIEVPVAGGKTVKKQVFSVAGTGVIFYTRLTNVVLPCLVTAKHVFHDPERGWNPDSLQLRFSWDQDKPIDVYLGRTVQLKKGRSFLWLAHKDSLVDLAVLPLVLPPGSAGIDTIPLVPYRDFGDSNDVYAGRTVWILGYPGSVGTEFWTRALIRQGIVSWISPTSHGMQKYLVDAEMFPGNSGGPVFGIPAGVGKDGNLQLEGSFKFIGIISQRRFSPTPILVGDTDVKDLSGRALYSLESIGIGVVEPSERVRELLSQLHDVLEPTSR